MLVRLFGNYILGLCNMPSLICVWCNHIMGKGKVNQPEYECTQEVNGRSLRSVPQQSVLGVNSCSACRTQARFMFSATATMGSVSRTKCIHPRCEWQRPHSCPTTVLDKVSQVQLIFGISNPMSSHYQHYHGNGSGLTPWLLT